MIVETITTHGSGYEVDLVTGDQTGVIIKGVQLSDGWYVVTIEIWY